MDTSEPYAKMCEKASEIQDDWVVFCGDYCLIKHPKDRRYVIVIDGNLELRTTNRNGFMVVFPESYGDNKDFKFKDTLIWLPRQDQLQEMIKMTDLNELSNSIHLIGDFHDWVMKSPEIIKYNSIEQLWLAFVMKTKYNKIWNSENWVNST